MKLLSSQKKPIMKQYFFNFVSLNSFITKDVINYEKFENFVLNMKPWTDEFVLINRGDSLNWKTLLIKNDRLRNLKQILDENCCTFYLRDNNIGAFSKNQFIFFKKNKDFLNIYKPIPFFIGISSQKNKINFNLEKKIKKKFLCLMNNPTEYREMMYDFLIQNHIQKHTYLSHNSSHPYLNKHKRIDGKWEKTGYNKEESSFIVNYLYNESFCNIIVETICSGPSIQITEKTDKSFFSLQPFIVFSAPFFLKKLKELGFKTFDKWWDESYDLEEDYILRFKKITKVLEVLNYKSYEDLKKMYLEMNEVLEHNKKLSEKIGKKYKKYTLDLIDMKYEIYEEIIKKNKVLQ